ncbi:hypothetical protein ACAG96_02440 [Candidatus Izemoplasma sp. B36]|uniref:hypothetical protein n=1 Tax=Candidatus Izemoplasma sp. B36 TaxID=3242468 RepID=UPI003558B711
MEKEGRYEKRNQNIMIIHVFLLIIPMIMALIIIKRVNSSSYLLPFLYCYSVAGYIINLGSGRLGQNVDECKYTVSISSLKFKKMIHVSTDSTLMSKVDYIFQISGYLLLLLGTLFSIIIIAIVKYHNLIVEWNSLDNKFFIVILIYLFTIVVLGTLIRVAFRFYETKWCKDHR